MASNGEESRSAGTPGRIPRGLQETGRVRWSALTRGVRVSIAGVLAAATLSVVLGAYIPRTVEHHALDARLDSAVALVRVLERERLVPAVGEHLAGEAYRRFDAVVRGGLLGGENVRVKLWNTAGEVVYSDEPQLAGLRFPIDQPLASALSGHAFAGVTDLSARENVFDRRLGPRLLEFYVPLHGPEGTVIGAFEIYQDFALLAGHLSTLRRAVWISVGSGLFVLAVFLGLLFLTTANAMAREQSAVQQREEDLAVLLQVSRTLSSEPDLDRTGGGVLAILRDRLGLRCAGLLLGGDGPRLTLAAEGTSELCPAAVAAARVARDGGGEVARDAPPPGHADAPPCSLLAVPFRAGHDIQGALVVCREEGRAFSARERMLLAGVAGQLGVAAENGALFSGLQEMTDARGLLLRQLVTAQEEERRHLVGDLHDGLGGTLTRVLYGLRGSRARLSSEDAEVERELSRLESLVDEQARSLRRYMATIRPELLDDFGLARAMEAFAREQETETGLQIDLHVGRLPDLEPATAVTLFRAAQEAVMNVRRHAEARRVWIGLDRDEGAVVLEVRDDGRGAEDIREGIGLAYMRGRVTSLGGHVDFSTRPGRGTTVSVTVPLEGELGERPRSRS